MTMAPDRPRASSPAPRRRPRREATLVAVVCLAVTCTLVFVVLWALSARALSETRTEAVGLSSQVADLQDRVAAAEEERDQLQRELAVAQEFAETGIAGVDAERTNLQNQAVALREREEDLDARETELDELATELKQLQHELEAADGSQGADHGAPEEAVGRAAQLAAAEEVVAGIGTVDDRLRNGTGVPQALTSLADGFAMLAAAGPLPGVAPASYLPRLAELERLTDRAAARFERNPLAAAETYSAVRERTVALMATLDRALGTDFQLT